MMAPLNFHARIEPQDPVGEVLRFQAPADQSLLRSAARAGVVLPSSCRNGTCRTCICRLLEGHVSYRIDWPGLLPEEKAQGFILPCVAQPESDVVLAFAGQQPFST